MKDVNLIHQHSKNRWTYFSMEQVDTVNLIGTIPILIGIVIVV